MAPWESMRAIIAGDRLSARDVSAISTDRAYAMATSESAKMLGMDKHKTSP